MKINETPIRTSVNYGINDFEVKDNIFEIQDKNFDGFSSNVTLSKETISLPKTSLSVQTKNQLAKPNKVVNIEIDEHSINPIKLDFDFENNDYLVDNINILVKKHAKNTLFLSFSSKKQSFHNGFIKIICEENSNLDAVMICDLSSQSENFITVENTLEKNSNLNFKVIDFSGETSILRYTSDAGDNSKSIFKNIYLSDIDSKIDLNIIQKMTGKKSECQSLTIGALQGSSQKNYKGTIDFVKGCKGSYGDEKELCLTLSSDAKSKALPILLSGEEDVSGSHSASTGKINNDRLFYCMSRGLSKKEALKLLVKAEFNSILNEIEDEKLKEEILQKIDRKINVWTK